MSASASKAEVWRHLALVLSFLCCMEQLVEHCLFCAVQVGGCGGAGGVVPKSFLRRLVPVSSSLLTDWVWSLSAVLCREEAVFEQGERQMERLLTLQELADDEVSDAALHTVSD